MAPTISGATAKHKPRGESNPGMAAGSEGPLSQTSNINNMSKDVLVPVLSDKNRDGMIKVLLKEVDMISVGKIV
jgi:hypothetical protein